jgi:hypothetical protein
MYSAVKFEPYTQSEYVYFYVAPCGMPMYRTNDRFAPLESIPEDKTELLVQYLRTAKLWNTQFNIVHLAVYTELVKRDRLCECEFLCLDDRF